MAGRSCLIYLLSCLNPAAVVSGMISVGKLQNILSNIREQRGRREVVNRISFSRVVVCAVKGENGRKRMAVMRPKGEGGGEPPL